MKELKTDITISAPIGRVWDILADFEKYPSWNPFIVAITGDLAPGGHLRTVMSMGGKERKFQPVVTGLSPGKSFEWLGQLPLGLFTGNHYFELRDLGGGQTHFVHGERFGGLLRGLVMRQIGNETRRGFEAMNQALKARAEAD